MASFVFLSRRKRLATYHSYTLRTSLPLTFWQLVIPPQLKRKQQWLPLNALISKSRSHWQILKTCPMSVNFIWELQSHRRFEPSLTQVVPTHGFSRKRQRTKTRVMNRLVCHTTTKSQRRIRNQAMLKSNGSTSPSAVDKLKATLYKTRCWWEVRLTLITNCLSLTGLLVWLSKIQSSMASLTHWLAWPTPNLLSQASSPYLTAWCSRAS